jgi:hypothetical protein
MDIETIKSLPNAETIWNSIADNAGVEIGLSTEETRELKFYYVKLTTRFINDKTLAELKGSPLSVFFALGLRVNNQHICFPSIDTIAEDTGYSTRQVKRALKLLTENKFITPYKENGRQFYLINKYIRFGRGLDSQSEILLNKSKEGKQ